MKRTWAWPGQATDRSRCPSSAAAELRYTRTYSVEMNTQRLLKQTALVAAAVLAFGQLIRPARTNPPVDAQKTLAATADPPANVMATLNRACGDCHSSQTRWPWYSNVAPISWLVVNHVNEGRRQVSFSRWADYDTPGKLKALRQICRQVERRNMPLTSYLLLHRDAQLSDQDRQAICNWTRANAPPEPNDNSRAHAPEGK